MNMFGAANLPLHVSDEENHALCDLLCLGYLVSRSFSSSAHTAASNRTYLLLTYFIYLFLVCKFYYTH